MPGFEVKRTELKYYIDMQHSVYLARRLPLVLSSDPYSLSDVGYHIRSLYFDSMDDECLYNKQAGTLFRKKFRIRIYGPKSKVVKFEIKHKMNNQVFKETALISRSMAKKVINGSYRCLLDSGDPILHQIYTIFVMRQYRPKVVVDYYRRAFIYPYFNIRITLDRFLKSNCSEFDIFHPNLPTIPVILEGKQVLEVKYDKILPDFIRDIMGLSRHERMAISKYTLSRRYLKTRMWEDN